MKLRSLFLLPILLSAVLALTSSAHAWDSGGHMLVAQIALARLTPEARARAQSLLPALVNPAHPDFHYDFVTAATWMDDIRDAQNLPGAEWTKSYPPLHYVDIEDDGTVPPPPNALSALKDAVTTLQNAKALSLDQSRALGVLLHVTGDIHQPLHAYGRDKGGNEYPISGIPGLFKGIDANFKPVPYRGTGGVYQRLHALWDSMYRYDSLTQNGQMTIAALPDPGESSNVKRDLVQLTAMQLITQYPPGIEEHESDPTTWARESAKVAMDWVFSTPRAATPSTDYIHRGHEVACGRIVLAGFRLGDLLNRVLVAPH